MENISKKWICAIIVLTILIMGCNMSRNSFRPKDIEAALSNTEHKVLKIIDVAYEPRQGLEGSTRIDIGTSCADTVHLMHFQFETLDQVIGLPPGWGKTQLGATDHFESAGFGNVYVVVWGSQQCQEQIEEIFEILKSL
jgi:hypothetical protein